MRKILLFCKYDWREPKAGPLEQYAFQVFRRIAAQGHLVTWIAHGPLFSPKPPRPPIELADSIQIVHLGMTPLYRFMMGMFLSRLAAAGKMAQQYDVIVDCVTGMPLDIGKHTQLPVVPIVFHLHPRLRAIEDLPGPIIAATDQAHDELCRSGVPPKAIVRAPLAADTELFHPAGDAKSGTTIVLAARNARFLRNAKQSLRLPPQYPPCEWTSLPPSLLGRGTPWRVPPSATAAARVKAYQNAIIGVCGEGYEHESLSMAACALPVLCPGTQAGREYVRHEVTGLLYEPGNGRHFVQCLHRLLTEVEWTRARSAAAREDALNRSWDKTARLILATLENL